METGQYTEVGGNRAVYELTHTHTHTHDEQHKTLMRTTMINNKGKNNEDVNAGRCS